MSFLLGPKMENPAFFSLGNLSSASYFSFCRFLIYSLSLLSSSNLCFKYSDNRLFFFSSSKFIFSTSSAFPTARAASSYVSATFLSISASSCFIFAFSSFRSLISFSNLSFYSNSILNLYILKPLAWIIVSSTRTFDG